MSEDREPIEHPVLSSGQTKPASSLPTTVPSACRLEGWALVMGPATPYTPPELITQHLFGLVKGHSTFVDGSHITTSRVIGKRMLGTERVVVTVSGSCYALGEVEPQYEKLHPGAKERLFSSLPFVE